MAADFWRSSHGNFWLVDRRILANARTLDLKYATAQELAWIGIWSANAIHKLAKRLSLRQQVTATAVVFLRRFYLKNSYCETDIPLVAAACVYVAAKAEETAIHMKLVVTEARATFGEYGITTFPSDATKLAEMEFYLIEDLEFHFIVYHPYRSLVHMSGRDGGPIAIRETMIDMDDNSMQMAWFVLNDSYRSHLCLLYPPHIIATAAIYLAFSLHMPPNLFAAVGLSPMPKAASVAQGVEGAKASGERDLKRQRTSSVGQSNLSSSSTSANVESASSKSSLPPAAHPLPEKPVTVAQSSHARGKTDPITFLASLNVQMPLVLEVVQEMISLYALWQTYEDAPPAAPAAEASQPGNSIGHTPSTASARDKTPSLPTPGLGFASGTAASTPGDDRVIQILQRIRASRELDLAHPANAGQSQRA